MKNTKKKKTKKLKSSSLKKSKKINKNSLGGIDLEKDGKEFWASPQGISIRASAEGKPDPYARVINVYEEATKVKNFKQLENFLDMYSPGMDAALAAKACIKFTQDNWDLIKIARNPENHGALFQLLDWIDKKKGGARAAFEHRVLKRFIMLTGYKKPPTFKTFQNQITEFKSHFNLVRKKTGEYSRKQFEVAKIRLEKKNSRHSIK